MYHKTVLKNGIRIISERLQHYRSVSLGIWVNVGSRDEMEDQNGISHFIEHMTFKGTRKRSSLQIAKELDAIGGFSNAFTGAESTCFHARVLDKHLETLADILGDIFLNSLYDPQDMNRERQVILQEINMLEDTPDEQVHVLFNEFFWLNHPLGKPIMGTPATVSAVNEQMLRGHIRRFYTPGRILVAAAGNVDHNRLVRYLEPLFEPLCRAPEDPVRMAPSNHYGVSCHPKDLEQVHLCLGGNGPRLSNDLRFAGAVLNAILGGNMSSRLFQEIREKRGLAYNIFSFVSSYIDAGMLGIYVATDRKEVNRSLKVIKNEIRKIQKGDVSKSDLDATLEHLIGGILLGSESTDARMIRLAKNEGIFGRYISYEEVVSDLQKVTVDQVVEVALQAFDQDCVSLVTLGPLEKDKLDLSNVSFR
jgi:predicted Zn-dependent peptidase